MGVSILNFKENITQIPNYNDGFFQLFEIRQTNEEFPKEYLHNTKYNIFFEELSLTDKLKFESEERNHKLVGKIRITQTKQINSLSVIKIDDKYYKVFNAYHFTNSNGYKQTDLTLEEYPRVRLESEVSNDKK